MTYLVAPIRCASEARVNLTSAKPMSHNIKCIAILIVRDVVCVEDSIDIAANIIIADCHGVVVEVILVSFFRV